MDDTAASPAAATATAAGYDASREKATTTNIKDDGSGSNVRLLIKSSNQQYDDMIIESDLCWTVQRLKKQLFLVYPGKPDINDQKLIYSGKLLDDNQKLSEVIRSYKDVYQQHNIFHLVCANKNVPKAPLKTMPKVAQTTTPTTTTTAAPTTATGSASTAPASGSEQPNELRHRHATQDHQRQQQLPQQGIAFDSSWTQFWQQHNQPNQFAGNTNPQQLLQYQAMLYNAWMQQVYAQYMQQMNGSTSGSGLPNMPLRCNLQTPQPVVSPVATADAAAQMPARADDEGAAAAAAAAAVVENERRNFHNIQEEPEIRDWLDSFFSFTRLAVFFTVLYFNSSPLRCLLVVLIAGVIYLYHIGVLRRRPERNNNNINRNNNAGNDAAAFAAVQQIQRMMDAAVEREQNDPQAANEPVAGNQQDNVDAAANGPAPAGSGPGDQAPALAAEAVAVDQPNANNSVISVVRTFVVTFFTSLLPEAPAL
ncbi:homocysteine-responsive endoplasmic reticulum-resident ubiquitin-like domain member 2 protein [Drosophila tropicalis]|uniref:homocysteine-responsive endoplasmic reticulum-resident ubiquitin-like domain member 2 protein n=1 Tax=Drosophila tropicalis TaxID=46794 RepID=UPI0035AC1CCA